MSGAYSYATDNGLCSEAAYAYKVVMAYIVKAYVVMAYTLVAYGGLCFEASHAYKVAMAYEAMAYVVMAYAYKAAANPKLLEKCVGNSSAAPDVPGCQAVLPKGKVAQVCARASHALLR